MATTRVKRLVGNKSVTFRLGGYGQGIADFPFRLWELVGWWWSQLKWSTRAESRSGPRSLHEVTWLELAVDFELPTGTKCVTDFTQDLTWGARARLLKYIAKKLLEVRGLQTSDLRLWYGEHRPGVAPLASVCLKLAAGLRRRPFFLNQHTLHCVGKNAYVAAEACSSCPAKESEFGQHVLNYTGFKGEEGGGSKAAEKLLESAAKLATKPPRRLSTKTCPSTFILHCVVPFSCFGGKLCA